MKTLLTIFTLVFNVMFSTTSFGGWTKVTENSMGTYHVDFKRIRKHNWFVYYWELVNLLKPFNRVLSYKIFHQGDCKLLRHKILSFPITGTYGWWNWQDCRIHLKLSTAVT